MKSLFLCGIGVILSAVFALGDFALAQPGGPNRPVKTILDVEIMLPSITGDPLLAQKWRQVFEEMDVGVLIRQPLPGDRPEVKESLRGTFRLVKASGELDGDGHLRFAMPEGEVKIFQLERPGPLKEWLNELRVFGAQGSPEGKANWGLSRLQFEALLRDLQVPVMQPTTGVTIEAVLAQLPVTERTPIRFHTEALPLFDVAKNGTLLEELHGLSLGTSLAYVLRQTGLGFRPLRNPEGVVELVVEPLLTISDPWPVGWKVEGNVPRNQIVPGLFEMVNTGFENASLVAVLDAIEMHTQTPVILDRQACLAKEIDPDAVIVNYPIKKTAWSLLLRSASAQARLTVHYMQDEAGKGFVTVAPFVPYLPPPME